MRQDVAEPFFADIVEDAQDIAVIADVHYLRENATSTERSTVAAVPPDVLCGHIAEDVHYRKAFFVTRRA
jgi:hypothetical protein